MGETQNFSDEPAWDQEVDPHSWARFGLEIRALENGQTPEQQLRQEIEAAGGRLVSFEKPLSLKKRLAALASVVISGLR